MRALRDVLVISDLDGTLLDHETYSWKAAEPALNVLRAVGAGVILASSKTAAEISVIRDEIGFSQWPSIVENGCGILEPGAHLSEVDTVYQQLRKTISGLPEGFRGFGDMTDVEVSDRTGLTKVAAKNARARQFSEPGIWEGTDAALTVFLTHAEMAGLTAQRGGRFITLSFGGTKADRVSEMVNRFQPYHTIVLGDAPNDVEMLKRADTGVIIANPASPQLPKLSGESTGQIRRVSKAGPVGWAEAVLEILEELALTKDTRKHG